MILTIDFSIHDGIVVIQPKLTPLEAQRRLKNEGPFVQDLWKYEWGDDAMSPSCFAEICFGDPRDGRSETYEFFANGEPEDPIDENSFWIAA